MNLALPQSLAGQAHGFFCADPTLLHGLLLDVPADVRPLVAAALADFSGELRHGGSAWDAREAALAGDRAYAALTAAKGPGPAAAVLAQHCRAILAELEQWHDRLTAATLMN